MSRTLVGDVYAKVINEVCEASRIDFEEGGVELSTLEMLKAEWQRKLSGLKVAQLPWDPTPVPAKDQNTSGNAKPTPTLPSNGHVSTPPSSQSTPSAQIKSEAQPYPAQQLVAAQYSPPNFPNHQKLSGSDRAALNLHQKFGNQAGTQIAQLQQQSAYLPRGPAPNQHPGHQQLQQPSGPFIKREDGGSDGPVNQEYRPEVSQSASVRQSQTDGAMDQYESEVARRRAAIIQYRQAGDRLMHNQQLLAQQELEAGGLLLPLDVARTSVRATNRTTKPGQSSLHRAQGDAAGDDEEEDEDAINSDLDDPDELDNAANDEEAVQEVMLCTYDKVQRVKNKWKCTLKDGILRVEGSEYVFHKGQGEFEW